MKNKTILSILILITAFSFAPDAVLAKKVKRIVNPQILAQTTVENTQGGAIGATNTSANSGPVNCNVDLPEKQNYSAKFIAVRKKAFVAKGEIFKTEVYIQNTGNMPWFSFDSGCKMPAVNLGTERTRDRASTFYFNDPSITSNWLGNNRIKMETKRVDPQNIATFSFWSKAPQEDGYYREFFEPLVEGVTWINGGIFHTDTKVGEPVVDPAQKEWWTYIEESTDLSKLDLTQEKSIEVDLSSQTMWLKIGDHVVRQFRVSTGKSRTPTPVGTTKIIEKREVRVAGKAPHYIMPKWMMYRKGGYGIHALPSLANDRGVYWREALSHIGIPVSHGCIRLLPKDAEYAYNFAEVGTTVTVHR